MANHLDPDQEGLEALAQVLGEVFAEFAAEAELDFDAEGLESQVLSSLVPQPVEAVEQALEDLNRRIDDSNYPPEEWAFGIVALLGWLEAEKRTALFADVLGFVSCVAESQNGTGVTPPLAGLVRDFLASNGFDKSRASS